eukprot:scaffold382074_cov40-Prasinocladus_malaysianus.AAC.2
MYSYEWPEMFVKERCKIADGPGGSPGLHRPSRMSTRTRSHLREVVLPAAADEGATSRETGHRQVSRSRTGEPMKRCLIATCLYVDSCALNFLLWISHQTRSIAKILVVACVGRGLRTYRARQIE